MATSSSVQLMSSNMSDVITAQPLSTTQLTKTNGAGTLGFVTKYWKYILFAIVFVGGLMYYMKRKRLKCSKGAFASLSNFLGAKRSSTPPAPSVPVPHHVQQVAPTKTTGPMVVSTGQTTGPTVAVPDTTDPNFTPLVTTSDTSSSSTT